MSILFYHIFLWLYRFGIQLITPWNRKAQRWVEGRKGIFDRIQAEMAADDPSGQPAPPSPGSSPATNPPAAHTAPSGSTMATPGSPVSSNPALTQGGPGSASTAPAPGNPQSAGAAPSPAGTAPGSPEGTGNSLSGWLGETILRGIQGQVIWMHCSSLGEFEQGRPVLESLRRLYPGIKIVLTFFSPSGYEVRKDYEGADHIFYLPLDSRSNARQFINLIKPTLVLWVKYDYWYYYLAELKKRKIPTILISGVFRGNQPFFRWYGKLHRYMLECFTHIFAQTENGQALLNKIGLKEQVSVGGDTRFDRVIEIAESNEDLPLIQQFCGNDPVIVAGSTWEEDEEELDHFANTRKDVRFIIAPHEIGEDRIREVEALFRSSVRYSGLEKANGQPPQAGPNGRKRQQAAPPATWPNVLIIDNIGMLSRLYKYASIAYVGGGFGDDGVHNVLEAAVYGKPVVYGPVIEKYVEAVDLVETGGAIVIDSALEVESAFSRLLSDPEEYRQVSEAARKYVHSKKGATAQITNYIQENSLLSRW